MNLFTQGLLQSRRRSVRHHHGVRAVLTVGGAGRRARSRLEARAHGGVHGTSAATAPAVAASICSTREGELVNIEGDPDHPVNQGGLCPKGANDVPAAQRGESLHARGDQEPEPQDPSDGSTPRRLRVGGYHLGRRRSPRSRVGSRTRAIGHVRDGVQRHHGQPLPRHRQLGRQPAELRGRVPHQQDDAVARGDSHRQPRPVFDTAPRLPVWQQHSVAVR